MLIVRLPLPLPVPVDSEGRVAVVAVVVAVVVGARTRRRTAHAACCRGREPGLQPETTASGRCHQWQAAGGRCQWQWQGAAPAVGVACVGVTGCWQCHIAVYVTC